MMLLRGRQRGETIVEVMMSAAILGLVVSGSFVVARRSLNIGQQAKERTQALKIVEAQIERLKFIATQDGNRTGEGIFDPGLDEFCISVDPADGAMTINELGAVESDENCDHGNFPESNLRVSIIYDQDGPDASNEFDDNTYVVTADWDRIGGEGVETLSIVYRLHPLEPPILRDPIIPVPQCGEFANIPLGALSAVIPTSSTDVRGDFHPANDPFWQDQDPQLSSPDEYHFNVQTFQIKTSSDTACSYSARSEQFCTQLRSLDSDGGTADLSDDTYKDSTNCGVTFSGGVVSDATLKEPERQDQPNEAGRVYLYETYTVDRTDGFGQDVGICGGSLVAYFDTTDEFNTPPDYKDNKEQSPGQSVAVPDPGIRAWTTELAEGAGLNILASDSSVSCVRLQHICDVWANGGLEGTSAPIAQDELRDRECLTGSNNIRNSSFWIDRIIWNPRT